MESAQELVEQLRGAGDLRAWYADERRRFIDAFMPLEDGQAAARLVDAVMRQEASRPAPPAGPASAGSVRSRRGRPVRDAVRQVLRLWPRQRPAPQTLDPDRPAERIDQSSARRDHLRRYERELVVPAGGLIVVWARRRPAQTANTFAEFYPHARVLLLAQAALRRGPSRLRPGVEAETVVSVDAVDQLLVTRPRPCVIIDSGSIRDEERTQAFRRLFLHLAPVASTRWRTCRRRRRQAAPRGASGRC